ncbi:hypothetical protein HGRIS_013765 [Hohenbuehelia grisea]|uniref:Uncharacterized protein n=1 Tax=Hohenbuehelia grisea TaxID=104357 RepID=A0ABR3IWK2_9AGAR
MNFVRCRDKFDLGYKGGVVRLKTSVNSITSFRIPILEPTPSSPTRFRRTSSISNMKLFSVVLLAALASGAAAQVRTCRAQSHKGWQCISIKEKCPSGWRAVFYDNPKNGALSCPKNRERCCIKV